MKQQTNTIATVLITAALMLCLFAFQNVNNQPKPLIVTPEQTTKDSPMRDYQLQFSRDGNEVLIFDDQRFVGHLPLIWKNSLGKILITDNE